ncbi:hypothetical protein HDU97_005881 [Phlyctochytrium planicorne]|nr:hypothetical protein HDU97_005881 [Phlyctochytrium planicorne]
MATRADEMTGSISNTVNKSVTDLKKKKEMAQTIIMTKDSPRSFIWPTPKALKSMGPLVMIVIRSALS